MKAHYRTRNPRLTFEVEGESTGDLLRGLAKVQETFDADATCGCCGQDKLFFRMRVNDENEFLELVCESCTAALSFGQRRKDGNAYPHRRDTKSGKEIENRGWRIWRRNPQQPNGPPPDDRDIPF